MTDSHLRTRLLIAAQRFANELADALEEAAGDREKAEEAEPKARKRRVRGMRAPAPTGPVSAEAEAKAEAILERSGLGRTGT